ncbi:MAG: hypothetical protein IT462_13285 [Planctomycetes bacterium]|nr:hypothetical protein [Planctomycetota bacterium]
MVAFTLDNALMIGALVIGPGLVIAFILSMRGAKRRALLRRAPRSWGGDDPVRPAAEVLARVLNVPIDRIRPEDRLVADLQFEHYDAQSLLVDLKDRTAAERFMAVLHERTVADLGMLLAGVGPVD